MRGSHERRSLVAIDEEEAEERDENEEERKEDSLRESPEKDGKEVATLSQIVASATQGSVSELQDPFGQDASPIVGMENEEKGEA